MKQCNSAVKLNSDTDCTGKCFHRYSKFMVVCIALSLKVALFSKRTYPQQETVRRVVGSCFCTIRRVMTTDCSTAVFLYCCPD